MDTSDPDIAFDSRGFCNHCTGYFEHAKKFVYSGEAGRRKLDALVHDMKERGRGREHDCVMGLSGGVDSTYSAVIAGQLGLRPLCVHLDNGWDSELAVKNIELTVRTLGFDLYTHVIDWEEFKDLQLAYLRASVVDVEVPTDHAITACLYSVAAARGIRYILSGSNVVTESIMPERWFCRNKNDLVNLRDIHRTFGSVPLRTFPMLGLFRKLYYHSVKRIRTIKILDHVPYNKKEAKKTIMEKLGWRDYGYKHYESFFTKFYQAYILPVKFGVDKRRAHLSTLICSGQMTREEALVEISGPPYKEAEIRQDREYALKKFGLTEQEFEDIMRRPAKSHSDYKSDARLYGWIMRLRNMTRKA
jgi:N-acetyl sugar amidotransferase